MNNKKIIDQPLIIKKKTFIDSRGEFYENYNKINFLKINKINFNIVQHNISTSKKGVIRGLHYQLKKPQAKIIRAIKGKIFDVVLDLRINSKNYGKWKSFILEESSNESLYIPKGFAHGFMALKENTIIEYFVNEYRYSKYERTIIWNDEFLKIKWPKIHTKITLNKKDLKGKNFKNCENF